MSRFSGPQGKGAMREHRAKKRREAEERNATAFASRYACGHVHGERVASRCRTPFFKGHGIASSNAFNQRYECPCGRGILAPLDDPEFMTEVMDHELEHAEAVTR